MNPGSEKGILPQMAGERKFLTTPPARPRLTQVVDGHWSSPTRSKGSFPPAQSTATAALDGIAARGNRLQCRRDYMEDGPVFQEEGNPPGGWRSDHRGS